MKLWVGRTNVRFAEDFDDRIDQMNYLERHPEKEWMFTKLLVLYDKPSKIHFIEELDARIACEIPNYMFPEIEPGECIEFISNNKSNS